MNNVQNILNSLQKADRLDYIEGADWYKNAHGWAAAKATQYGFTLPVVAAVIAALSPLNEWKYNLLDAETILAAVASGAKHPFSLIMHCTYKNRDKAFSIAQTGDISLLKGDKVTAFYDNILNHANSPDVTVDRHAYRVYLGDFEATYTTLSTREVEEIKAAYRLAAEEVGLSPLQVQAITWTTARRYRRNKNVTTNQLSLF